jgi:vacuolar-type H+-ATPase subunit E/Vma4
LDPNASPEYIADFTKRVKEYIEKLGSKSGVNSFILAVLVNELTGETSGEEKVIYTVNVDKLYAVFKLAEASMSPQVSGKVIHGAQVKEEEFDAWVTKAATDYINQHYPNASSEQIEKFLELVREYIKTWPGSESGVNAITTIHKFFSDDETVFGDDKEDETTYFIDWEKLEKLLKTALHDVAGKDSIWASDVFNLGTIVSQENYDLYLTKAVMEYLNKVNPNLNSLFYKLIVSDFVSLLKKFIEVLPVEQSGVSKIDLYKLLEDGTDTLVRTTYQIDTKKLNNIISALYLVCLNRGFSSGEDFNIAEWLNQIGDVYPLIS